MEYKKPETTIDDRFENTEIPQFVSIGFDDNGVSGYQEQNSGMDWANRFFNSRENPIGGNNLKTYDGEKCSATYFCATTYIDNIKKHYDDPELVKLSWQNAIRLGSEVGNHTHNHKSGKEFTVDEWVNEIEICNKFVKGNIYDSNEDGDDLKRFGKNSCFMTGFRAPFLHLNDKTFEALLKTGYSYDASIEEGWQPDQDGSNYFWPYTLHNGSPGYDILREWNGESMKQIGFCPGLWEIPTHAVIVPPDSLSEKYNIKKGLRKRLKSEIDWFDVNSGKITGLDYNLWIPFKMDKSEFLATLKYTLDLRYNGNRCPFTFGAHSEIYSHAYKHEIKATVRERQEAIEEFIDYALKLDDVRVVSHKQILNWIRKPISLDGNKSALRKDETVKIPLILSKDMYNEKENGIFKIAESLKYLNNSNEIDLVWKVNNEIVGNKNEILEYQFNQSGLYTIQLEVKNADYSFYDEKNIWVVSNDYLKIKNVHEMKSRGEKYNFMVDKEMTFGVGKCIFGKKIVEKNNKLMIYISQKNVELIKGTFEFNKCEYQINDWMNKIVIDNLPNNLDINFKLKFSKKSEVDIFWYTKEIGVYDSEEEIIENEDESLLGKIGDPKFITIDGEMNFKIIKKNLPKDWNPEKVIMGISTVNTTGMNGVININGERTKLSSWYTEISTDISNIDKEAESILDIDVIHDSKIDLKVEWWCG